MKSTNSKYSRCENFCKHFCNWITQLGLLISICILIAFIISNKRVPEALIIITTIFYAFYIITCFSSTTFRYFLNKHQAESIHNHMEKLYYTPPRLIFRAESYHYETVYRSETDSEGNTVTSTSTEKRVTHIDTEELKFCSWRDISGLFLLDSEKFLQKGNEKKVYLKLELTCDLDFADDLTKYDYEFQKEQFKMKNVYKDDHMDFSENLSIDSFTRYNLVKISDEKPICLNICVFLIFTFIIPFMQFYKIYVNSLCINQEYRLKKLVSSRYNLNNFHDEELNKRFSNNIPKIHIHGEETIFDNQPHNYNKVYDLPTEEEIQESKKFSSSKYGSRFTIGLKAEQNNAKNKEILNKNDFEQQNNFGLGLSGRRSNLELFAPYSKNNDNINREQLMNIDVDPLITVKSDKKKDDLEKRLLNH